MKLRLIFTLLFFLAAGECVAQGGKDFNTILIESTFKITGPKAEGPPLIGTGFIVVRPSATEPGKGYAVLVTAAHVLEGIQGEKATLWLRRRVNDEYVATPLELTIRSQGKPNYYKHPEVDVAVMYAPIPRDSIQAPIITDLLATDDLLLKYRVHPGDSLFCLGYPLGASSNDAGFPILRKGSIASYPLLPTKKVKAFAFDFNVFGGNSGGPVYLAEHNRGYDNSIQLGEIRFIVGLVSEQMNYTEVTRNSLETRVTNRPLGLAVVIYASFIREAIEQLPVRKD